MDLQKIKDKLENIQYLGIVFSLLLTFPFTTGVFFKLSLFPFSEFLFYKYTILIMIAYLSFFIILYCAIYYYSESKHGVKSESFYSLIRAIVIFLVLIVMSKGTIEYLGFEFSTREYDTLFSFNIFSLNIKITISLLFGILLSLFAMQFLYYAICMEYFNREDVYKLKISFMGKIFISFVILYFVPIILIKDYFFVVERNLLTLSSEEKELYIKCDYCSENYLKCNNYNNTDKYCKSTVNIYFNSNDFLFFKDEKNIKSISKKDLLGERVPISIK